MEIVLTVIGVLVFFGGSYFIGDFLVGDKNDILHDRLMNGFFFGVSVVLLIFLSVGVVSACVHKVVVSLIN